MGVFESFMWYREERNSRKKRRYNRRLDLERQPILMVTARLAEQKKERMHRVGGILLLALVLGGTVWVTAVGARVVGHRLFTENDRFLIEHMDIRSDGRLRPEHVREYARLEEGMNLFAVNIGRVREELESVPAVRSVRVTRRLPDTLIVEVTERVAAARLDEGSAGYPLAVDLDGVVLGPTSLSAQLPLIVGVRERGLRPGAEVSEPAVRSALELLALCEAPEFGRLVRARKIDVSHGEYLEVLLSGGERIAFPVTKMKFKLDRLCELIKRAADAGKAIATADLTVDRNFPVQYQ